MFFNVQIRAFSFCKKCHSISAETKNSSQRLIFTFHLRLTKVSWIISYYAKISNAIWKINQTINKCRSISSICNPLSHDLTSLWQRFQTMQMCHSEFFLRDCSFCSCAYLPNHINGVAHLSALTYLIHLFLKYLFNL